MQLLHHLLHYLIGVYSFGKISLAHFNPAVTIGYYITGHITKFKLCIILQQKLLVPTWVPFLLLSFIGEKPNLGANAPNL